MKAKTALDRVVELLDELDDTIAADAFQSSLSSIDLFLIFLDDRKSSLS